MPNITEYRGIRGLVAAKVLTDTGEAMTFDTPFPIAGTSELSKETASASEAHYYDNQAAVIVDSVGADTVTITASALPLDVVANVTGQVFDTTTGTLIETGAIAPYMAIGYITEDTNGDEVFVWRYKGKFGRPGSTHATKTDGTDANGQELTYTGIATNTTFAAVDDKPVMAINCKAATCGKTESEFFSEVQTPDDIIVPPTPPTPEG